MPLRLASGCWAACPATRLGSARQTHPSSAGGPTDGPTEGSFAPSAGECHGATTVFFNTTFPPTMTWRYWIDSEKKEETSALVTGDIQALVICQWGLWV